MVNTVDQLTYLHNVIRVFVARLLIYKIMYVHTIDSRYLGPRDSLKYFEIVVARQICRIKENNKSNNHTSQMIM